MRYPAAAGSAPDATVFEITRRQEPGMSFTDLGTLLFGDSLRMLLVQVVARDDAGTDFRVSNQRQGFRGERFRVLSVLGA
jgi:hypothetical protein